MGKPTSGLGKTVSAEATGAPPCVVESLESRLLLASPKVAWMVADNRGDVTLRIRDLDPATVNNRTVLVYQAGADNTIGTADDQNVRARIKYKNARKLKININMDPDTPYRIRLIGNSIKDIYGRMLDGEFNGVNVKSGDGRRGGDFDVSMAAASNVARFITRAGEIYVLLDSDKPNTLANFKLYANATVWDGTFIHRSSDDGFGNPFVIQGGGFRVEADDSISRAPSVSGIDVEVGGSHLRGTIGMARGSSTTSNTNQWFFNLSDNTFLDAGVDGFGQKFGYTKFGQIVAGPNQASADAGLAVMDSIYNDYDVVDASSDPAVAGDPAIAAAMTDLPVTDEADFLANGLNPRAHLVHISRVSLLMSAVRTGAAPTLAPAGARFEDAVLVAAARPGAVFAKAPSADDLLRRDGGVLA
mgnify:CR=1 FL=1